MRPYSLINPYTFFLKRNKPKHLPLAYHIIKPPINKPMLNPFTNFLPIPETNKWTLLWNLAKNYLNHNNPANLNNPTPASNTNANSNPESPNQEPTNKEAVATSTPTYTLTGEYSLQPNQKPSLSLQAQLNKPAQKNTSTAKSETRTNKRNTKPKPSKHNSSKKFKAQAALNSTLTLNLPHALLSLGLVFLTLLSLLMLKNLLKPSASQRK